MLYGIVLALAQTACPLPAGAVDWRMRPEEPARVYLFVDGRQRGGYDAERNEWRDFDPDREIWTEPRSLFPQRTARADAVNFGVMRERLTTGEERFTLNGSPAPEHQFREAAAGLVDDSQALRLTVIGTPEQCRAVLDDLDHHPDLAAARRGLLVQAYDPEHWAVAAAGFARSGTPTIYLQTADGRVLHRQDEYRGPQRLAAAIRRTNPDYRPERDPDLDRLPFWSRLFQAPVWAWAAAALLVLIVISQRRKLQ